MLQICYEDYLDLKILFSVDEYFFSLLSFSHFPNDLVSIFQLLYL